MLQYITRGNTSPVGKPKVFFTAHPADVEKYQSSVARILLDQMNMAIYYDDGQGNKVEWWKEEYGIQILVIPVTLEFLDEPNAARLQDLEMAKERHIPILPLTFNNQVSQHFSEVIGEYQCLYAGVQDGGEKNFYQKLSEYLGSILEPEEVVMQIMEQAFDLNLFISYRKVDRAYVNDYVKMIHKKEELEGVGYWYDEELTPGCDYNDEIDKAMRKADLFVLIITPAILEGDNYVKRVEYTQAVAYGKKILPVELVETNRAELEKSFPGLKDVIWLMDIGESFVRLSKEVKKRRDTKRTSKQNYLLGLAYTNGVGVELNYSTGRKLLMTSAEEEFVPAISKLAELYRAAIGVAYDPDMVVKWQGKLLIMKESDFKKQPDEKHLLEYLHSLYEYGVTLLDAGTPETALQSFLEFMRLTENYGMTSKDAVYVCYEISGIYQAKGELELAEKYNAMLIDLTNQCAAAGEEDRLMAARACFVGLLEQGDCYLAKGDFQNAQAGYREAEAVARKNYERFQENDTLSDLASLSSRIGKLYEQYAVVTENGKYLQPARDAYIEAVTIRNQVYKENRSVPTLVHLIRDFLAAGRVCDVLSDKDNAIQYFCKATNAVNVLRKQLPLVPERQLLQEYIPGMEHAYLRLSELFLQRGRESDAAMSREMYESIMEILE